MTSNVGDTVGCVLTKRQSVCSRLPKLVLFDPAIFRRLNARLPSSHLSLGIPLIGIEIGSTLAGANDVPVDVEGWASAGDDLGCIDACVASVAGSPE